MIGSSKNKRENYPRKCFRTQEKETRVKFNPGLSANQPSNNWAQKSRLVLFARFPVINWRARSPSVAKSAYCFNQVFCTQINLQKCKGKGKGTVVHEKNHCKDSAIKDRKAPGQLLLTDLFHNGRPFIYSFICIWMNLPGLVWK